jgi:NADH dehydrogenase FAD-containing subunit
MVYILDLVTSALQQAITYTFHFLTANYFVQTYHTSLDSETMKNIVILGGSFAGISTAHRLLKQSSRTVPFKVTLISPNTHFYWNLASPLGLIPDEVDDEELFRPIVEGFSQYTNSQFEFIVGSAESVNIKGKKVGISTSTGPADLEYDFLILATGSRFTSQLPFKGLGSTEATKEGLNSLRSQVKMSKTIVIAGAGVSGCEISGELAFQYGKEKDITLVSLKNAQAPSLTSLLSYD